jgi:hypothetical protein
MARPGGAILKVEKKGDKYEIEIKTKDGSKKFEGTAKGDAIEFVRNGKTETIKAASSRGNRLQMDRRRENLRRDKQRQRGFLR